MSRFLKLSNCIINTAHIAQINITPNYYNIYYNHVRHNGFMIFYAGWINNQIGQLEIGAATNPDDYKIVSEWIEKINNKIE